MFCLDTGGDACCGFKLVLFVGLWVCIVRC